MKINAWVVRLYWTNWNGAILIHFWNQAPLFTINHNRYYLNDFETDNFTHSFLWNNIDSFWIFKRNFRYRSMQFWMLKEIYFRNRNLCSKLVTTFGNVPTIELCLWYSSWNDSNRVIFMWIHRIRNESYEVLQNYWPVLFVHI